MNKYDYYIEQYKQAHQDPKTFPGISLRYYVRDIKRLIEGTNSKTLLDYGCGKGEQYTNHELMSKYGEMPNDRWGITPTLYDPAVPSHDVLPEGTFDGVICTDVMEHIPESGVDIVFEQALSKADKFAFFAIATYIGKPTSYKLPNGEQPHITVKSDQWWIDRIKQHNIAGKQVQLAFNGRNALRKQVLTGWRS